MDMDVIQELSEDRCYLNALAMANKSAEVRVNLVPVSPEAAERFRRTETIERIFGEPLGRIMFRRFLKKSFCAESLQFLDAVSEYKQLPPTPFREKAAKKILAQHLLAGARLEVCVDVSVGRSCSAKLGQEGPTDDLFDAAEDAVLQNLRLSCLPSFVTSGLYTRLLQYRIRESEVPRRENFVFIRVLGEGGFGKVYAVSKTDTSALYACKMMEKDRIALKRREGLVTNERNILTRVDHPFIVSLRYAFQDERALYLVMDLLPGGELGYHLGRFGRMPEPWVRFYGACIVLALEYLHARRIAYRDLKPENVMLDADGHIKLTDLGLCTVLPEGERLHQHCGTRSYMAPEQCYGDTGYGLSVDWWALGVTLFHFITGKNPFSRRYRRRQRRKEKERRDRDRGLTSLPNERAAAAAALVAGRPASGGLTGVIAAAPAAPAAALGAKDDGAAARSGRSASVAVPVGHARAPSGGRLVAGGPQSSGDLGGGGDSWEPENQRGPSPVHGSKSRSRSLSPRRPSSRRGGRPKDPDRIFDLSLRDGDTGARGSESGDEDEVRGSPRTAGNEDGRGAGDDRGGAASSTVNAQSSKYSAYSRGKTLRTLGSDAPVPADAEGDGHEERRGETPQQRADRYAQLEAAYVETLSSFPWPSWMSEEARSLCSGLLQMDPSKRLGTGGAAELKSHPFFAHVDWKRLAERHVTPPFVPDRGTVHAKYIEPAQDQQAAASRSKIPRKDEHPFPGFDYVRPNVLQDEVLFASDSFSDVPVDAPLVRP